MSRAMCCGGTSPTSGSSRRSSRPRRRSPRCASCWPRRRGATAAEPAWRDTPIGTEVREVTAQIARLRGVTRAWRPEAPPEAHAQPGMGIVAQEVEAVFPELVETRPDGFKQVDYDGLIAPLLKAVAELRARLALLENREGSTMDAEGDRAGERVSRAAQAAAGTSLDVERLERV